VASAVYRYARVTNESSSNYYAVAMVNNAAANARSQFIQMAGFTYRDVPIP
jgi:hypothetical protein